MTEGIACFFKYIPLRFCRIIAKLPESVLRDVNEIRLRKGRAFSLTLKNKSITLDEAGRRVEPSFACKATEGELSECVSLLLRGSAYAFEECVAQGFVPLPEGGRAGICGNAVTKNGIVTGFSEITSVDLRLHRHIADFAMPLIREFAKSSPVSTLVCSPPGCGKTTFLRSAAYALAEGRGIRPYRVGIVDERSELHISGVCHGLLDVITGCKKAYGISLLTRTMSPEIIVCDEISEQEREAVLELGNSGALLIASVHAGSLYELEKKSGLLSSGVFGLALSLSNFGIAEMKALQ